MVAKPFRALMICAGGMSSSLVETHIRRAAEAARGEAIFRQMLSALEGRGARRQADGAPERIQKP